MEKLNEVGQDLLKTRISFWEKLVLVDAGALTLSLSAATAFRGHTVGDAGVGYLFGAWRLLLLSIALATMAQWLTASAINSQSLSTYELLMSKRMGDLRVKVMPKLHKPLTQWAKEANKKAVKAGLYEKLGSLFGAGSVLSMLLSLFLLAKFGRVNLPVFLLK